MDELGLLASKTETKDEELVLDLIADPSLTGTAREELLDPLHVHEASGFSITIRQTYLVQGTYAGKDEEPATLLGLNFELRDKDSKQHRRFRHFVAGLRFETDPLSLPRDDPFVKSYAPAQQGDIYLLPTQVHRTDETSNEVELGVEKDPVPLKFALKHGRTKGQEWDQLRKATISAQAYKSHTRGGGRLGEDQIVWTFAENEKQESLPDTFSTAVLLRRTGNSKFKVHFDLKAKIDFWYGTEVLWQKVKEKITFHGVREKFKIFEPTTQGNEPPNTNKNNLQAFVKGNELDKLVFLHLPELVAPVCFYKDGRTEILSTTDPSSPEDQKSGVPTSGP